MNSKVIGPGLFTEVQLGLVRGSPCKPLSVVAKLLPLPSTVSIIAITFNSTTTLRTKLPTVAVTQLLKTIQTVASIVTNSIIV